MGKKYKDKKSKIAYYFLINSKFLEIVCGDISDICAVACTVASTVSCKIKLRDQNVYRNLK
jgi:hypothetical protein